MTDAMQDTVRNVRYLLEARAAVDAVEGDALTPNATRRLRDAGELLDTILLNVDPEAVTAAMTARRDGEVGGR